MVELTLEEELSINLSLYPNPVEDQLKFTLSSPNQMVEDLSIIDGLGKVMWEGNPGLYREPTLVEIAVSNWASGIYYLRASTETKTVVQKFVKE